MKETNSILERQRRISRILRRWAGVCSFQMGRVWRKMPAFARRSAAGRLYARGLHSLVRFSAERSQSFGTFFLRNRAELELMRRLLERKGKSASVAVLACSKGAEVYSILWSIRSLLPEVRLCVQAVDISEEILGFARNGVYSSAREDSLHPVNGTDTRDAAGVSWNTRRDQIASIFERMTEEEVRSMFDMAGSEARVRSWLQEGITWRQGDAGDPRIVELLGPQDIVVANRFLCHMRPEKAETCLRNVVQLVKPGGYLFVSGVDLDVRTKVARNMSLKPVIELIREVHEGDVSLRKGWPLEYWGLEPIRETAPDWTVRYASVFQVGLPD